MERKGFTLVELLVVIAIIALLMGILMPALARVRQIAFRMVCGTNLSGIGKAMLIYANDYEDELPRAGFANSVWGAPIAAWDVPDRATAFADGKATITSSFYLLVKYAEVTPKSFICKGDAGTTEFKLSDYPLRDTRCQELIDAWDFGGQGRSGEAATTHCSYAYHQPYGLYALTTSSEPSMAVAADRNPWISSPAGDAKLFPTATDGRTFLPDIQPHNGTSEQAKYGNAVAHQEDGQNVLFLDSHVNFEKRSFCGIEDDNIYTYVSSGSDTGSPLGLMPAVFNSEPGCRKDCYVVHDGEETIKGRFCFPAETLVWVNGTLMQISSVTLGQTIGKPESARACLAQARCREQIERIDEHEGTFECYDVALESGDHISVVGSHLFLVASDRWVSVKNLRSGQQLRSLAGVVGIDRVSKRAAPYVGKVYNLKIRGSERYFVGKQGLMVRDW